MGLDMYLRKKTYVKNWDHMKPEERHQITITKGGKLTAIQAERIEEVSEDVGYWRKANAIHKWFVDHVQNGVDDCGDYEVSRDQLRELLDTVNKVIMASRLVKGKIQNGQRATEKGWEPMMEDGLYIEDPKIAHELLPTTEGFFFGNTDYDEYYHKDLVATQEMLTGLLAEEANYSQFYYHSSW